jgi:hypothetical protein
MGKWNRGTAGRELHRAGLLAEGLGKAGDHSVPPEESTEGYRRLTFMMLDADIVAVSPASVWRVLSRAGLLRKWNAKPSKKGTGFEQPPQPHQHWHIDVCLPECLRDVLLSVQHPGRLQPFPGSL